jgi:hypothetical protein
MRSIYLSALVVLIGVSATRAEDGVLVDHVPGGADPAVVIAVVRQALINRQWAIKSVDETSVDAAIERPDDHTRLHIALSNRQLIYKGSTIKTTMTISPAAARKTVRNEGNVRTRWIDNLRSDIATILATMPEAPR